MVEPEVVLDGPAAARAAEAEAAEVAVTDRLGY